MCGVAGFFGKFSPELLSEMTNVQRHRGPDAEGQWFDLQNGVGLCHQRLAIIDLSPRGVQPMWDSTKRFVISYNGEIYNYRELRKDLENTGFIFHGQTDTEVLLNLYHKHGTQMLSMLNGIFAFALWDNQEKKLLLARDGFGVKPLYLGQTSKGYIFASELKALLKEPTLSRDLNPEAFAQYLAHLWCPGPQTPLQAVTLLSPGTALILKDEKVVETIHFYDLPWKKALENRDHWTEEEAKKCFLEHFEKAIERQMISDVPVGTFLSGGLDSTSIAYFARKYSSHRLQCFTISYNGKEARKEGMIQDLPYAQKAAKLLDVDLHVIEVGPEMINDLSKMIYHLDVPLADPAALNQMYICQLAQRHGYKVLLSGTGGDDLFSGYRRHFALLQEKYWAHFPLHLRKAMKKGSRLLPTQGGLGRRMSKALQYADLKGDDRLVSYFYWTSPDLVQDIFGFPFISTLKNTLHSLHSSLPPLDKMLYLEGKHFLADHNLIYGDKMSMAYGVEVRVPFLDPDLVDFAYSLPVDFKQRGHQGKWVFKKAMESYLPKEIIYRPKTGFGVPLRHWMTHELCELKNDLLSEESLRKRGLFSPRAVHKLIRKDDKGELDGTYSIFSLMCMELWCRIFIDNNGKWS